MNKTYLKTICFDVLMGPFINDVILALVFEREGEFVHHSIFIIYFNGMTSSRKSSPMFKANSDSFHKNVISKRK